MTKWIKAMAIVISLTLLGSAIGFGVVLAADSAQQPAGQAPSEIYQTKLAARLGVTVDALKAAITQAQATTLDQLVSQGRLTAQQKQQILDSSKNAPGFGVPEFPGVTIKGQTAVSDMFLNNFAAALKTTVEKLKEAMTQAETDVINDLAAQGKINDQQMQQMLARLQKDSESARLTGPGFSFGLPPVGNRGHGMPPDGNKGLGFFGDSTFFDKLASKLGITRQKLDDAIGQVHDEIRSQSRAAIPTR